MRSIVAPGQGSQSAGMLTPWLAVPGAAERVATWSGLTGLDLEHLGTAASAEEVTDTAVAQPLIVAVGLLAWEKLSQDGFAVGDDAVVAGHSIGELTAAAVAGVISSDDAVKLAAIRGGAMAKACAISPTGMSALLGGDEEAVLARLDELGLVPANRNAKGQIVAAGSLEALEELKANAPAGARIRPLSVAGAFHTEHMATAREAVAEAVAGLAPADPVATLLSNTDGKAVRTGAEVLARIVTQVTSPVRWDLCQVTMRELGVETMTELPPAGTLSAIAKRELPEVNTHAVKKFEDLALVAELG
ncbi:MAG: ACP S-malonyltransferase [Segniliparus sp.]|uniref:ACP S-malonyltransferase n=1 Tax=Segniliparus sp. TaxID=2804064 RepID=UPI003F413BB6